MTEASSTIDAEELRARLPDKWRVETDAEGVYGYADGHAPAVFLGPKGVPACFSIHPNSGLWAAIWKSPHDLGDDPRSVSERVIGVRERCVEWVVKKVAASEGRACE
ncbi:hypothetical protein [Haloarchaeobius salinus]|uniref:hypothetical protein n=1 Tax=Haloarchaeobius salinus TaxID=1198298 RepID=UPI00210E5894|nr:hypothetical protein [Haloarchaeobius salinus]